MIGLGASALTALGGLAAHDRLQKSHSVLRNYPVLGRGRYLMEAIRPELQQYFIERDVDGRPFDRNARSLIYQRAKGVADVTPFGTERDVDSIDYEWLVHSMTPKPMPDAPPRVRIGGPDCTRPYDMSLFNVSGMSFGALSANAVLAMNHGAALGGFAQDTGEGGLSDHHLAHGGDLVWEIGTGYFGARNENGEFDPDQFARQAAHEQVKMIELKLSQGAKPGLGGVLPGAKVSEEIAAVRMVPPGETCVSPAAHRAFSTPVELIEFIARLRELSGGKPTGFKLCVGSRTQVLALCKAMHEVGTTPDFIVVDGSEGGTGAAPLEFEDHVGMPLTQGLLTVQNALVGAGLRDTIRLGASGKISAGNDVVRRLIQGADFTSSARAMMMAVGCIQAQRCHTDTCPVGVTTQDPRRTKALVVEEKSVRVQRYHESTVHQALRLMASMGVSDPSQLRPEMLRRNLSKQESRSYAELHQWLAPGELLNQPPEEWAADWANADPHSFAAS
ncbi:FMN-binding glutamate synthase family protein [Garicola koreensis]